LVSGEEAVQLSLMLPSAMGTAVKLVGAGGIYEAVIVLVPGLPSSARSAVIVADSS